MNEQTARELEAEAARWVARMDGAALWGEAEEAELQRWLGMDRRCRGALLQAQAAWASLNSLRSHGAQRRGANEDGVVDLDAVPLPRPMVTRRLLMSGGVGIAASLAAGLFLFGSGDRYETQVGEIRRVPLADGSTMAINTASLATVDLEKTRRRVRIERGELWFQVAKNPARPFVVEAGRVRVQAVGTAFAVRRRDTGAEIFVTEGVVEAWADDAAHIRIGAGGHAFIADNAQVTRARAAASSVDRALAWREGKIDLSGTRLADAAADFNRYNSRHLVVTDPVIADERFDGVFRTDDLEGFAVAIRESLGVPVDLSDPAEIRIGSARK